MISSTNNTAPTSSNFLRMVELKNVSVVNKQQSLHAFDRTAISCIK